MRHQRRRGTLGLVQEHRRSLLRNLARSVILHQRILTTHARAKETSRFVDQLVTIAKTKTLHARRQLIRKLGSGSEVLAKRMIETVAPRFTGRSGGYTRVLRYKDRIGDGASLSLLEFSVPIETMEKKPRKKKEPKPQKPPEPVSGKKETKPETPKAEPQKETPKKGGFLGTLRRFLKGGDERNQK